MALQLVDVTYRYAGATRPSLTAATVELEPGRVLGVAGANESGKSTLCLVGAGLAPGTIGGRLEGRVLLDGVEAATLAPYELAQRCAILFQHATTQLSHTTTTVFEEVAFGPCNLGLPVAEVLDRVTAALAAVRIEELAARDPARLSGGQSQLVALASVLALRPRYLILDEPTSELDPVGTAMIVEVLANLVRESGVGLLIVEHKTDVLAGIADEMVVLDRGHVALSGPAARVLADPALTELGVEPPARVRIERELRAAGAKWTAELREALA